MELYVDTQEVCWGDYEYDDILQGLELTNKDILYSQLSNYIDTMLEGIDDPEERLEKRDEILEELSNVVLDYFLENAVYENVVYVPFYNQSTKSYDVRVSFDYSSRVDMEDVEMDCWHECLSGLVLETDGHVDRKQYNYPNDGIIAWLQEELLSHYDNNEKYFLEKIKNFILSNELLSEEEVDEFILHLRLPKHYSYYQQDIKYFEKITSPIIEEMILQLAAYENDHDLSSDFYIAVYGYLADLAEEEEEMLSFK